jgi:hypothetical protein
MPKVAYDPIASIAQHADMVAKCERICQEYARAGYSLTLRGLYYQLVARDEFPNTRKWMRKPGTTDTWVKASPDDPRGVKNATPNYKWLSAVLTDARMAGLIDWRHLDDQGRAASVPYHWETEAEIMNGLEGSLTLDKWAGQERRIEVWVEKDALSNVVDRAARAYDCTSFACKGYVSTSTMWQAAQRLERRMRGGQGVTILHLGDHDPSGIDMTRDITDRLTTFIDHDLLRAGIQSWKPADDGRPWLEVIRIALNMDQIELYNPPPNPAKLGDSRAASYLEQFGDDSWELDALEPQVLDQLIRDEIERIWDADAYHAREAEEERRQEEMRERTSRWADIQARWDDVLELLER